MASFVNPNDKATQAYLARVAAENRAMAESIDDGFDAVSHCADFVRKYCFELGGGAVIGFLLVGGMILAGII